ncbi:MAG: protein kinase [Anaerolineae bacterium]|nr:protein kinase [Anaerolineae bacterium]
MQQNYAGQILKSYQLAELIDVGGSSAVYRAHQAVVEREVAIKIIFAEFASHPNFIRRFESEAQLVAGLEHPYIVPLYDYWRDPNGAYIVMRWLRGGHLRQRMLQGRMSVDEVARVIEQISAALIFAHYYGVVHRDLKPENILLDEAGNAYLADFGIAQILNVSQDDDPLTSSMGSPAYAAPEQINGRPTTQATDQYSLGIILYEMLTGQYPFPDLMDMTVTEVTRTRISEPLPPLALLRPDLPSALGMVIQTTTALNPADRYRDIAAMLLAFQSALEALLPRSQVGRISALPATRTQQMNAISANLPNPYKGLRPFQEADAGNFHGRRAVVDRLIGRMSEGGAYSRFLAVVGPSGSGKSSVVKAGLIPALRAGSITHSARWFIIEMVPSAQPFKELEAALTGVAVTLPQDLAQRLSGDARALHEFVRETLPNEPGAELLLFIDQFEELFTQSDAAQRDRFLEALSYAVGHSLSRIRVVITLRADFYDRPLMNPLASELISRRTEVIVPLKASELSEAVAEPARRLGVELEPGLENAIISEVKDHPTALPLLQYMMSELFQRRQGGWMTLRAYEEMGGVRGALAQRAEEIYQQFTLGQRVAMQQLFLRLITLGEGAEDTRRRALLSEVNAVGGADETMRAVIATLVKTRLIALDRDPESRSPTVEVTHEALIREWQRLREWLNTSRGDVRMQRSLAVLAEEWANAGEDLSYLLRDARLRQFDTWSNESAILLTAREQRFLASSLHEQEKRRQVELERAAHERRLEAQSRARLRILAVVLSIALVVGLILTAYALNASARAQAESDISRSLAQASGARQALAAGDVDLAAALALAANGGDNPAPQALRTLTEVAYAPGTRALLREHTSSVTAVDIDRSGRWVASACRDGVVRLWSLENNDLVQELRGHRGDVETVAFSPDGRILASGGLDFVIILWDVETGAMLRQLTGHGGSIRTLAFSPDGRTLVSGARDSQGIVWEVETGERRAALEGHRATVQAAAINPDGTIIASGAGDGEIILWDAASGAPLRAWRSSPNGVNDLDFTPDGSNLISALADRAIARWSVATGESVGVVNGLEDVPLSLALMPDGINALVGLRSGTTLLLDVVNGRESHLLRGHTGEIQGVALSPDGRIGATGSTDATLRLWNIVSAAEVGRYSDHTGRITGLTYSGDGSALASASVEGALQVRAATSGEALAHILLDSPIRALAALPDSDDVVVGLQSGVIQGIRLSTGEVTFSRSLHSSPVLALTVSADGEWAASSAQGEGLLIWNTGTGEIVSAIAGGGVVLDLALSPDRSLLAFGAEESDVVLWDTGESREQARLRGHAEAVSAVAFSPDGARAASGSRGGVIIVWDVASGVETLRLTGHARDVWSVAFSPDGRSLVSAGGDGAIIRWDAATGEQIERFTAANSPALKIALHPSTGLIASGDGQGVTQVWQVFAREALIGWMRANHYIRDLTCQERAFYRVEPFCPNDL